jgi:hypothetical protein
MSQAALPALEIGLKALSALLDKADAYAAAKKIDPAVLLNTRLAGVEPPRFEDIEKTLEQLKERIAKTVTYVTSLDATQIDASAERQLSFPLGPKNKGEMKAADYLNHFLLPNFYFHLTTAYDILRHCGVELSKPDYLGAIPMKMSPR